MSSPQGATQSYGTATASFVPAWQIASRDVLWNSDGAAMTVRIKDSSEGIRGTVALTLDLAGPASHRPQIVIRCASSDRLPLATDCADEALSAWPFLNGLAA